MQISQPDENGAHENGSDVRETGDVAQILEGASTSVSDAAQNQCRTYGTEDRHEHKGDTGGAEKKDVKGRVHDDSLCY